MTRFLLAALLSLTLVGCGGAKTGEGYTSGICKDDVVEDFAKWGQECSTVMQRSQPDFSGCKKASQDFLEEYPGVSCEINTTKYRGGGYYGTAARIDHTVVERYVQLMEQYEKYRRSGRL